ncbi:MAG: sigma-70 family RNA polymerase sigma factor [Bacteroidota bacterium]
MQKTYSDKEIVAALLQGGPTEDAALRQVYVQHRMLILDFVKKNNGSAEEAKDVFQESVTAFYENVKQGRFKGDSAVSSYLYSIARFNWLNRLKRKGVGKKILETHKAAEVTESFLPRFLEKEKERQVLGVFEKLGGDCKKVLVLHIYQFLSMQEIAATMNYDSDQVARNKKYKCLKKLKELIAQHPEMIEFLINEE